MDAPLVRDLMSAIRALVHEEVERELHHAEVEA